MTGAQVKEQIHRIAAMSLTELDTYRVKVSTSSADTKAKGFLYRACDEREVQLTTALAVSSEIRPGEVA